MVDIPFTLVIDPPPVQGPGMTATVTVAASPYHQAGTFTYAEADGTDLGTYADPRGAFTVSCRRVKHAACELWLDFRRISGSGLNHAYVVFNWGDVTVKDAIASYYNFAHCNVKYGGYSVTISGDFSGTASVSEHYRFARWRWCSWGAPEAWPFPVTPTKTLQDEGLLERFDPAMGALSGKTHDYTYTPMKLSGTSTYMPGTGTDGSMARLTLDQAAEYFSSGATHALRSALAMAEGCNTYPWYTYEPPGMGALMDLCGPKRSTQNPSVLSGSSALDATITGPPGTTVPACTIVDANGVPWNNEASRTIGATGSVTFKAFNRSASSPYLPRDTTANFATPIAGCSVALATSAGFEGIDGIVIDSAHMTTPPYAACITTRDPYHIETMQAIACFYHQPLDWKTQATIYWPGWAIGQVRAQAWCIRDLAQAALATPDAVPGWLLPKASFTFELDQKHKEYCYRFLTNQSTPGAAVFHSMFAAANGYSSSNTYMEDYLLMAFHRALRVDPTWADVVRHHVQFAVERVTGANGWCKNFPCWYGADFAPGGKVYPDWASAWAGAGPTFPSGAYPCPASLPTTYGDYLNTLYEALGVIKQTGVCNDLPGFLDGSSYFFTSLQALWTAKKMGPMWSRAVATT